MTRKTKYRQDRAKFIYILHQRGYTFEHLAKVFNISKQYAFQTYWQYWDKIKEEDLKTCDLCNKKSEAVRWWKKIKLCPVCIRKIRKTKKK